jgi:hypothetical protein
MHSIVADDVVIPLRDLQHSSRVHEITNLQGIRYIVRTKFHGFASSHSLVIYVQKGITCEEVGLGCVRLG